MSHKTIIRVDGESRSLLTYSHNYYRQKQKMKSFDTQSFFNTPIACDLRNGYSLDDFEHFSEPLPHILGGMFYISFESTAKDDLFYYWMKDSEVLNGSIEFYNTLDEDDIPFQRIDFWDAFLVRIKEQTSQGAFPMTMECDISAAIVRHNRNNATLHRKSWYFTDIDRKPIGANNEAVEEEEEKEAKCTLYFRRPKNYKGEFGFDWLRSEDTGEYGDTWYKNIMTGGVQAYDDFVAENYTCFTQEWKKEHPDYNKNYTYTIPWLTLMPGKTAELRLKLEVEELAEKIELRFANTDDSQYLSLNFDNVPATQKGNYYHAKNLTITCNKQFSRNISINAYAGDTLVGRLIVLKNSIVKTVDIAIIAVKTKVGQDVMKRIPSSKMMEHFRYYLNQLYIEPNFIEGELNLTQTPAQMAWNMKEVHDRGARKPHKEIFIKGTKKQGYLKIKEGDERRTLINLLYKDNDDKDISTSHPNGKGFYESFHHFLNHIFYQQHPGMDELYKHVYKLYYFAEEGMAYGGLINGLAYEEVKAAAIFIGDASDTEGGYSEDTPAHELLHCFSLKHTFYENRTDRKNSKHLQNQYHTDNIMDYKPKTTSPTRVSILYWQMQQVWQHLKMK